jgi:transglutaminase-like putative cysteine protease
MSAVPERVVPIGRGPRSLLGTALAAGATCGSLLALSGLIEHGSWQSSAVVVVLLLAIITAGVRAMTRSVWLPSLVGFAVAALGILALYGGSGPGTNPLSRTWALGHDGFRLIQDSMVPMPAERSAELIVVTAAAGVFLLVDALALGADVPALAALPLVAFWLPAVFIGFPTNGWALFWTGLCYLLLLAVGSAPQVSDAVRIRQGSTIVGGAVGALVLAIVAAPVVTALPSWAAVSLPNLGSGPSGPLQLSDTLDLRDSLGHRSSQAVLTYTVSTPDVQKVAAAAAASAGPVPTPSPSATAGAGGTIAAVASSIGPLRAFTEDTFDGRTWSRTTTDAETDFSSFDVLGGGPNAPAKISQTDPRVLDVAVTLNNLQQSQLPIATFARTVQVDGAWSYDAAKDEVDGRSPTTSGQKYTMQVYVPNLTADDLKTAAVGTPPGGVDYLQLPDSAHMNDVRAMAQQIAGKATTPYAKAMALQTFLRSTANFTYDTRVPPATTKDAVWDFLQDRRGYCVQFATAMAIMGRTLGLPTRVAVGFLPGTAVQDGDHFTYVVSGKLAHAWPEVYFQDYGWVRFEPTPAQQTGVPPVWVDPLGSSVASGPPGNDVPGIGPHPNSTSTAAPGTPTDTGIGGAITKHGPWLPSTVVAVLALVAGAIYFVIRRRRRPVELTCERAWHHLRRLLARHASITWSDATTPRAAVRTVQERLTERTGDGLPAPALDALTRLASAVEQERYAPRPKPTTSAELHHWLATVRHAVEQQVNGRTRPDAGPSALPSES